jgi:hypothetical protein
MPEIIDTITIIDEGSSDIDVIEIVEESEISVIALIEKGEKGDKGEKGEKGDAGDGTLVQHVHTQTTPSTEWIVNHNKGIKPIVEVRTIGGTLVDADILHVTLNQFRVFFSSPIAGEAVSI